ncbi:hypothetical protein K443DRAFT_6140 [Laccaria amethystina LaAM-08-1]|uniref:Uncharacterized protein n=1 Tax=Laccaria amethystina LaAM-08-1 TaxID=1095629 RepID=A0A0C9WTV3_9AGAR|nr:hypothetical protein K443DRAFT_6140 [Laccaria amethystina LaAM-08-1]
MSINTVAEKQLFSQLIQTHPPFNQENQDTDWMKTVILWNGNHAKGNEDEYFFKEKWDWEILSEVVLSLTKSGEHPGLMEAYNESVQALKEFRDLHMVIVVLYIVGPVKRARERERERVAVVGDSGKEGEGTRRRPLKGLTLSIF